MSARPIQWPPPRIARARRVAARQVPILRQINRALQQQRTVAQNIAELRRIDEELSALVEDLEQELAEAMR